ncbi:hypothetical protein BJV78DRAFT_546765 [Lactifluus subvellereus]|nr:hypothetical protein BJV78DRAFT_546765 [Lactifluus subvellereus]
MPRLRVVAGPSIDALVPITVNSGVPHTIVSDAFEGQILAHIKGFTDNEGNVLQSEYFNREDRKGVTWSIQVQGRFLRPISADDVLFGNTFDRPLKLPWGSGAALKFMHFVDPSLEHDLASSTKPWALSPLISTMPYLAHTRLPAVSRTLSSETRQPATLAHEHHQSSSKHAIDREGWPLFPSPQSLSDDTTQLHLTLNSPSHSHSPSPTPTPTPSPLLSRQPSSGAATPDSDSFVAEPCNAGTTGALLEPPLPDKHYKNLKKNRLSPATLASLLSASHEDKRERKERKRAEKLSKHEQTLQELHTADRRRAYFRDASHRRELIFGPEDVFTTDFCYGFIQFTPTLSLQLPGGISFDLMHYWDGQPVRFMCCERKRGVECEGEGKEEGGAESVSVPVADSDVPWGRVLWCVAIELVPDEEQEQPSALAPSLSVSDGQYGRS